MLDGATYTLDNVGNRKTRTDKRTNITLTYGPDNIYQLLSAKQGTTTKESYTYDLVGNRLTSLGVSQYNYNSSNELTSTPSGSYTYDNNGNRKSDPSGAQYTWDYENRLTQEVLAGTGGTATFKYDPFGRRAQKVFTKNGVTTTTNYFYDGANILETQDQNGALVARYVDSLSVDEPLQETISGTSSYYEQDGLGSVSSISSSAGALANTYTYDSYGKITASSGTIANSFEFTGREYDRETGIYHYRARYYDQSVGRFTSEDPIDFRGGTNFYRYVLNSPTNLTDPWGLAPNCVMTHSGLVCTGANPVSDQIDVLQLFFPGAQRDGNNSVTIPMSCDAVNKVLANSGYYTGGPFSAGNWMTQNPFLFWDPIYHWGGSEWRNLSGFHFRRKYTLCENSCTLDEFHIDSSNPMFNPGTHFLHDFMGLN